MAVASAGTTGGQSRNLILAAMIFAVAMTFIDQTIVSIAAPEIQKELSLTSTGTQWAINAYLLSLASLFAFGGRLADTVGHRKMVTLGVIVFAASSAMCGLTPKGSLAEAWIVTFRVVQGAGGAIMFPAALAIVVQTFELRERGKALAIFFGIAGGSDGGRADPRWLPHAVDLAGDLLGEHSRRRHRPDPDRPLETEDSASAGAHGLSGPGVDRLRRRPERVRLSAVLHVGLERSRHGACIAIGAALLVVFYFVELRTDSPLIEMSIFRIRAFLVENLVLAISMLVFVPVFFFASEYAQIALGKSPSEAGLYILYFFIGFVIAAQIGGRMLDRVGGKRPVVLGCALSAVGFWLWAGKITDLSFSAQQWYIILAGAGMGMMLGPGQYRRCQSRLQALLWRGDGHNPDGPQLCRQSRPCDPRHDPGLADALARRHVADRKGCAQRASACRGVEHRPIPRRGWEHRVDSPLRAARLRLRHTLGALRDGGDHGGGGGRGLRGPACGLAGGDAGLRGERSRSTGLRRSFGWDGGRRSPRGVWDRLMSGTS